MNNYTVQFFAFCPVNGIRIFYTLLIEIDIVLMAESLIDAVTLHDKGFHEEIADGLFREFGGHQTLTADHHGVSIKTIRK